MQEWLRGIDSKVARRWAAIGVGGVVLVLLASIFSSGPATPAVGTAAPSPAPARVAPNPSDTLIAYETSLDEEVAQALSDVLGAGRVRVSITLQGSPAKRYAQNTSTQSGVTRQTDAQGGTETQTTSQTSRTLASGSGSAPVLTQEIGPEVVGVLVVASGASNPLVRDDLFQAATTLLGVPGYKVMVLP